MFLKTYFQLISISSFFFFIAIADNCSVLKNRLSLNFYLWKSFQRSMEERLFVDNVDSLEACMQLTRKFRGLAFNYSPKERFRRLHEDSKAFGDYFWKQPQLYFNCHILRCPENKAFKTMVNDTSFDYFSLYEKPMDASDYICLPEVGLFVLQTTPETFQNAELNCRHYKNYCGTLAHVVSQKRTESLTHLVDNYNEQQSVQTDKFIIHLAHIGLHFNWTWSNNSDFFNTERENLKCFAYRAWEPGNPKRSSQYANVSCVALTIKRTWKTVKCDRKLPYICEILTSCVDQENN